MGKKEGKRVKKYSGKKKPVKPVSVVSGARRPSPAGVHVLCEMAPRLLP
jgi:hypothetical protein